MDLKPSSPLMKFKQFLRGRRSLPDLRHPLRPNLTKTTIEGTILHDWSSTPNSAKPIRDETPSTDSENDSVHSDFSFNVSVRYYKEKGDDDYLNRGTDVIPKQNQSLIHDERVEELLDDEYDEEDINYDNWDEEFEDETDDLFNRDLFGLENEIQNKVSLHSEEQDMAKGGI